MTNRLHLQLANVLAIQPAGHAAPAKPAALLALSQAARGLGRSVVTLRRWHRAGIIAFVTINSRHYAEPSELAALLARHRQSGAA
jgi:hypothetical protein